MSGETIPVEEMLAAINQFIEDRHPEAAKFLVFSIVHDEEPYLMGEFPGVIAARVKMECRTVMPWITKETFIIETLSRIESLIPFIMKKVDFIVNNFRMCEKCATKMANYRRFLAAARIHNEKCDNGTSHELQLAVANILEKSLERQEHVADTLRPLPLPISEEIMLYFLA